MTIYVDDREIEIFLEQALPMLEEIPVIEERCYHCNNPMRFPIIARKRDIDSFKELLKIAAEYLIENGIQEKVLAEIMKKIEERLNIQ